MLPITLLVPQLIANFLTSGAALTQEITSLAAANGVNVPTIIPSQVVLNSGGTQISDMDVQLTYPRVSLYSSGLKNAQVEKFRSLSGSITVIAEIWASADLVTQVEQWLHYYVEAFTGILELNRGDWGYGIFFGGAYDVQFQAPASGGLGYLQSAKVTCIMNVSQN